METSDQSGSQRDTTLSDAIDGLWQRFLPEISERVAALEAAAAAAATHTLSGKQREAAQAAAHKLAGVLGTFGLARGTVLARELEQILSGASDSQLNTGAGLATAAAELRTMIENQQPSASRLSNYTHP